MPVAFAVLMGLTVVALLIQTIAIVVDTLRRVRFEQDFVRVLRQVVTQQDRPSTLTLACAEEEMRVGCCGCTTALRDFYACCESAFAGMAPKAAQSIRSALYQDSRIGRHRYRAKIARRFLEEGSVFHGAAGTTDVPTPTSDFVPEKRKQG